jgi:hypothetical protein
MTARKTTPHLKRGPKPKPKPKPPKRARGRPAKPLSEQPYRYFLAYYEAFVGLGVDVACADRKPTRNQRHAALLDGLDSAASNVAPDGCRAAAG